MNIVPSAGILPRLRGRLLASHALIVMLTLGVIVVSLYFFLEARQDAGSLSSAEVDARLAEYLVKDIQPLTDRLSAAGPTPRQQRLLNRLVAGVRLYQRYEVRLFVVDANYRVIYDTRRIGRLDGARLMVMGSGAYQPDSQAGGSAKPLVNGEFRTADGQVWAFVAEQPASGQLALMAATRIMDDTRILNVILEEYGDYLRTPIIQAGVIGLFTALLLTLIISRSVSRPLQKVAEAATAAAGGDLNRRAPVQGPQEVRAVAESFNLMTEEVARTQQMQRDFLANVSHDLRTPLTSIQGFSQAIMDGVAADPQAARRAAQIIHDEAGRLNRMVQELLDLAKIESGQLNMTRQPIKLHELLRGVSERLLPRAAAQRVTLSIDVPSLPVVAGDGDRLVQVFTNLLDNALKHTPAEGTVTISANVQDGGIVVTVRDAGEGISAADLPHIFDRFYQVDKSRQRGAGFGLGLTITKQIVEAHGGKISAESAERSGTAFHVWLPVNSDGGHSGGAARRRTA